MSDADAQGCWDPTHDADCTCGAEPPRIYEQEMERRAGAWADE